MPWNQCSPRIVNVTESCGCSLTRASIEGMTPNEFEALGTKEIDYHRVISQSAEARMTGVPENTLYDLMTSRVQNIKGEVKNVPIKNQSVILPYVYRQSRSTVNSNYFTVESGEATPGRGSNDIPASAWDIVVNTGPSPFKSDLKDLHRYFLPGQTIFVLGLGANGEAETVQFTIIDAEDASAGNVEKARISLEPNWTPTGFAGLSAGEKAPYEPEAGVVLVGANSISDYESWCHNEVAENNRKLLTYWVQTSRYSQCYNDEYLKALESAYTSGYFKHFRELPLAEQNKLQFAKYQRKWMNSFFYGQRINENQDPNTYQDLPQVTDIEDPSCTYEYKANALGIRTQLGDCSRVSDLQGAELDLDFIFEMVYNLKRHREIGGGNIETIDVMTDRFTADIILQVMTQYYEKKYNVRTDRYFEVGKTLKHENVVLFNYNIYQIPEAGVNLAVFTHPYFSDYGLAFGDGSGGSQGGADLRARGRKLWLLDWSDIALGIAGTQAVKRKQPDAATNPLYECVITPNVRHTELRSTKWTALVEDPNRHAIIENFSDACPKVTVAGCEVPNPEPEEE